MGNKPNFIETAIAWQKSPRRFAIMGFILLMLTLVWLEVSIVVYALVLGESSMSLQDLSMDIWTTEKGVFFILLTALIGFGFAAFVFLFSAISIPMILERNIGAFEAMKASQRIVLKNSHVMWSWAFTIGLVTWFALVTVFLGLIVVMPVLSFASWHAYRDLVKE